MGYLTPQIVKDLNEIFDQVHNVNSDVDVLNFDSEPIHKDNWFDKYVLRWF